MMYWSSFADFLNMGGYAIYVWGSYTVTVLILVIEVLRLRGRHKTLRQSLISEIHDTQKN
jgi:heme exporter protein D